MNISLYVKKQGGTKTTEDIYQQDAGKTYHTTMWLTSICLSFDLEQKLAKGWKWKTYHGMWVGDDVVVGGWLGLWEEFGGGTCERVDTANKNYSVNDIGITSLLCVHSIQQSSSRNTNGEW